MSFFDAFSGLETLIKSALDTAPGDTVREVRRVADARKTGDLQTGAFPKVFVSFEGAAVDQSPLQSDVPSLDQRFYVVLIARALSGDQSGVATIERCSPVLDAIMAGVHGISMDSMGFDEFRVLNVAKPLIGNGFGVFGMVVGIQYLANKARGVNSGY